MATLLDVNIWIALALSRHPHHVQAARWVSSQSDELVFCRITQLGYLRALTRKQIMGPDTLTNEEAMHNYSQLVSGGRGPIYFAEEPKELTKPFKRYSSLPLPAPNRWTDAYLAAFSLASGFRMATFDRGFRSYPGLDLATELLD